MPCLTARCQQLRTLAFSFNSGATRWFLLSRVLESKKASEHPLCQRKTGGGLEKDSATLWKMRWWYVLRGYGRRGLPRQESVGVPASPSAFSGRDPDAIGTERGAVIAAR